jgi:hypothetical protein
MGGLVMPRVQLISDFYGQEPYDHWFDNSGIPLYRNSKAESRKQGFRHLENMNLRVPYHGTVADMYDIVGHHRPSVVLYHDWYAHRGEGKSLAILHPLTYDTYPQTYAALTIVCHTEPTISYRYLRLGLWTCWLRYMSDDKWRSNCGNVQIDLYSQDPTTCLSFPERFVDPHAVPLLAIDFVRSIGGMWWAIDYNTSPGIKDTPVLDLITPQEIVHLVKEYYIKYGENNDN